MPGDRAETATLQAEYVAIDPRRPLDEDVLAAVVFGAATPGPSDPRCLRIDLEPLSGGTWGEIWRGRGPVRLHTSGPIRFAEDGECLAGWISVEEGRFGGLLEATEAAYLGLLGLHAESPYRHVWRIWNFVTAINEGAGDEERYRQFCLGRARAFAAAPGRTSFVGYPAASAVGKQGGPRSLQVCWFAGREPGVPIENPRQISAYHYPRRYGPAAPTFARAMVVPGPLFLVSGTASIVGHASMHVGDVRAQLSETLANLDALLHRARAAGRIASTGLGEGSLIKAYVRHPADAALVESGLKQHFEPDVPVLLLEADVCRRELLVEIEVAHPG